MPASKLNDQSHQLLYLGRLSYSCADDTYRPPRVFKVAPFWRSFLKLLGVHGRPRPSIRRPVSRWPGLATLRYTLKPSLRQRAQSHIYQYLARRHNTPPATRSIRERSRPKHVSGSEPNNMAYLGPGSGSSSAGLGYGESGGRRKRLAGYLKAAREMGQNYLGGEGERDNHDMVEDGPGAFPDAAVIRSGNEEMILFPSYARRHVKSKVSYAHREHIWQPPTANADSM